MMILLKNLFKREVHFFSYQEQRLYELQHEVKKDRSSLYNNLAHPF